jgi:cobalt-precorrin 5A hydrolase
MERGEMRVAGLGFRKEATIEALREALTAVGGARGLDALATATDKAEAAIIVALAHELGLTIKPVSAEVLARVETATHSTRVETMFGTGSLAEAAALAAAGRRARLVSARSVSRDKTATAAIAEGEGA